MSATVERAAIESAASALADAAASPAKVILFGSRARGDGDDRSDFDCLVIEREVGDRFDEMVRLDRVLGRMLIPADVVVISEQCAQKWGSVKARWFTSAMTQARVVAES
jgi:predicted nucleotidyltransferase